MTKGHCANCGENDEHGNEIHRDLCRHNFCKDCVESNEGTNSCNCETGDIEKENLGKCPDCDGPMMRVDDTWVACKDIEGCSWQEVIHEDRTKNLGYRKSADKSFEITWKIMKSDWWETIDEEEELYSSGGQRMSPHSSMGLYDEEEEEEEEYPPKEDKNGFIHRLSHRPVHGKIFCPHCKHESADFYEDCIYCGKDVGYQLGDEESNGNPDWITPYDSNHKGALPLPEGD